MKEATGELNMTVITVMIIAALGVVIVTVVVPIITGGMTKSARCATAYGCDNATCAGTGTMACTGYVSKDGTNVKDEINCDCN